MTAHGRACPEPSACTSNRFGSGASGNGVYCIPLALRLLSDVLSEHGAKQRADRLAAFNRFLDQSQEVMVCETGTDEGRARLRVALTLASAAAEAW